MIDFGKVIYTILSGSSELNNSVENRIYPLVLPENTVLPAIMYERNGSIDYDAQGAYLYNYSITINVLSNSYSESIKLSNIINNIMSNYSENVNNYIVCSSHLSNVNELFEGDVIVQQLTYSIKAMQ